MVQFIEGLALRRRRLRSPTCLLIVLANYCTRMAWYSPRATVSAVGRITVGNFRLIERLITQVARVMDINQLDTLGPDVVDAARHMLVIRSTQ